MKHFLYILFYFLIGVFTLLHSQSVVAFWDFNDGFSEENDSPQIVHTATSGNGIIYQQRADTDGNGKSGNAFSQFGITSQAGKSMAWDDVSKSGDNDAEFFITFSTSGFQNVKLHFDILGNYDAAAEDGIVSFDLKYDFNPLEDVIASEVSTTTSIKDFASGNSTNLLSNKALPASINAQDASFSPVTVDFGSLLDDQNFVAIRLDDFKENKEMSIDNLVITAVIPEPNMYATILASVVLLFVILRRK